MEKKEPADPAIFLQLPFAHLGQLVRQVVACLDCPVEHGGINCHNPLARTKTSRLVVGEDDHTVAKTEAKRKVRQSNRILFDCAKAVERRGQVPEAEQVIFHTFETYFAPSVSLFKWQIPKAQKNHFHNYCFIPTLRICTNSNASSVT